MSGHDPEIRFKHNAAIQSAAHTQRYRMHLIPDLYEAPNPMGYKAKTDMMIEPERSLPKYSKIWGYTYQKAGALRPTK